MSVADMDTMALVNAITGFKAAETAMKVQYAVAAKTLQSSRDQGQAVTQLLDSASQDFSASLDKMLSSVDSTRLLDTYA
jgi:hypothetical protein